MQRSSASSLFARSRPGQAAILGVLCAALGLVAAGCTDQKDVNYSPAAVQSAFAQEGVALYGPRQPIPDDPLAAPARPAPTPARPLAAVLHGVRDTVLVSSVSPNAAATFLRGGAMLVIVYPRPEGAQAKVRNLADLAGAEAILHTTDFGYAIKGNVVVDFRVYDSSDRIPGYLGQWQSIGQLNRRIRQQVLDALTRLP